MIQNGAASNIVDIYDNNSWTVAVLSEARYGVAATAVGTKVLFAGGYTTSTTSNVVDIYDNSTNTWTTATLSIARGYMSATTAGGKAFFAGGTDPSGAISNVVDIYDYNTNTWSTSALSQPRFALAASSSGTKAFFAGGQTSYNLGYSNVVDIYDTNTSIWTTATLSQARSYLAATSLGTKVFFGGGTIGQGFGAITVSTVDIYDNASNTWSSGSLSDKRTHLAATSVGTKVFFAGGDGGVGSPRSNAVDIFTIAPSIDGFTPITGSPGDVVTITGNNFDPNSANNFVYFNGTQATVTAGSFTSLTATVPSGATSGPISVTVAGVTATSGTNFTVTGSTSQTIAFTNITKTFGNAPFSLTATASSGLAVSYSCNCPGIATLSGTNNNTVTIVGVGTCDITASQAGNSTYRAAPNVTRTLTVNKANQTITWTNAGFTGKTYSSANINLGATSDSGLPVVYSSDNTNVAIIVSGGPPNVYQVDIVGVGTAVITASQPGNNNYNAATNVSKTLTVAKATPTITFNAISAKTYDLGSYQFQGTITPAGYGLTITYASSNPAVATIGGTNGDVATFAGVGATSITASYSGDNNFNAATSVQRTLTVNKGAQSITFGALSAVNSWDADFNLTGTATSGLPVSYASSNTAVATVTDPDGDNVWTVHVVAPGTTNITASQVGNTLWSAASNVVQSLLVKAHQTITFNPLANKNYGDAAFNLSATASSGLPVTYVSSDQSVATISGNTITIVGTGTTIITASQVGNGSYSAAPDVSQSQFVGLLNPVTAPSFIEFTSVTDNSMNIGFIPGSGNKHIVIIKPGDPSNFFTPTNNQFYSSGYTNNGSTVVMSSSSTIATVTDLSPSTKYYVKVFSYNEVGSFTSYLTSSEANAAQTTQSSGGGAGGRMASNSIATGHSGSNKVLKDYNRKTFDLKIFGNPFDEKLSFMVESETVEATVTLIDMYGRIMHESVVKTNETTEIQKPMSPGVYVLKASCGLDSKAVQVIKTK